jgi:hypothetical protein
LSEHPVTSPDPIPVAGYSIGRYAEMWRNQEGGRSEPCCRAPLQLRCRAPLQLRPRASLRKDSGTTARNMVASMVEAKRTLVKSPPELWEIVDDRKLMGRTSAELFGSNAIEVEEREPGKRLAWRVSDSPEARVELALAEKDWGTQVAIRVGERGGGEEPAGAVLERLLDELGSDHRRPFAAPESGSGSGERAGRLGRDPGESASRSPDRADGEGAASGIEDGIEATIQVAVRSATERVAASVERRLVAMLEEKAAELERRLADGQAAAEVSDIASVSARRWTGTVVNALEPDHQSLDELSELTVSRASERIEEAIQAAEKRLAGAGERLRSEAEEAHRGERARIEEARRELRRDGRQRELALAQQERDRRIQAAERQLAKQAVEVFARLEREVGRLQERARRMVVAAARKEMDRRMHRSAESALRDIEEKLTAAVRGGVAVGMARQAEAVARRHAAERSAPRPEAAPLPGGERGQAVSAPAHLDARRLPTTL